MTDTSDQKLTRAVTVKGALERAVWDHGAPAIIGDIKKLHGFGDQLFDEGVRYDISPAGMAQTYIDADIDAISIVVGRDPVDFTLDHVREVTDVLLDAGKFHTIPLIAKVRHRKLDDWRLYHDAGASAVLIFPRTDEQEEVYSITTSLDGAERVGLNAIPEVHGWNGYRIFGTEYDYSPIVINRRNLATGEIDMGRADVLISDGLDDPSCIAMLDLIVASGFTKPEEVLDAGWNHMVKGVMVGTHFMKHPADVKEWVRAARELCRGDDKPKPISWGEHMEKQAGTVIEFIKDGKAHRIGGEPMVLPMPKAVQEATQ